MSETKWTNEQWDAITEKDKNLLVAAAAGAGKTAVLVERIIKKITDEVNPVDIDKLLVVTFTNAAATEMRERIGEALSKVLEKKPDSNKMQRQMALLGKASITTIHSFCMEVIRNNFQSLSIDPNFGIADETESTLMKLEALNEVAEEQYEKESNEAFFELLECYGGNRDDQTLLDMVLSLYDFIQSSPWPDAWLRDMTQSLNVPDDCDFGETSWGKVLINVVLLELKGIRENLSRAVNLVKTGLGLEKYVPVYMEDLISIDGIIRLINNEPVFSDVDNAESDDNSTKVNEQKKPLWDQLYNMLQNMEFTTLPRASKEVDKDRQEQVKKIRDDVKARIKRLKEKVITDSSLNIVKDLKTLYPHMECLAELVIQLSYKYADKKNKKSVVDFNDLEHFCLNILTQKGEDGSLTPSQVALNYRERFCEILVDEYQDSNMVQEIIINMISKADTEKPNVFMVGDVKQSIYRFRQAKPELFLHKYNTYSSEQNSKFRKILLFKNFRGRKNVVDSVNFIFKQIMSVNVGELDYTDIESLNPGAVFAENDNDSTVTGGKTELILIQTGASSTGSDEVDNSIDNNATESSYEEQEDEEILDNIQCEARLVAKKILSLMKPDEEGKSYCVWDKSLKQYRRLEFKDIVILLRTTRNWSEIFTDELAFMGIPAFADIATGFFKTVEVQVILSLLQVIDNPLQDIPLLSVLRSPIVSFTTDELAEIRLTERKGPFFEALKKHAENNTTELSKKASEFIKKLDKWREESLYCSTDELIWRLYDETGYFGMVGAMLGGEQRQANLRMLFNRARQFEETSYKGLFNFINFIDKLKSNRGDMGSAKILSENDNVVRIMSIHKSKGLEFPVVFLSGCGKRFNLQDMNGSILLHQELGFGPEVVDKRLRVSWPSSAKQAIREKIKLETLSEEMRVLYVALTRAREKLIITGAINNIDKAMTKWLASSSTNNAKLPDYEMLKGSNYLDWMCPALLRHKSSDLRDMTPIGMEFSGCTIDDESMWGVELWSKNDVLSKKISTVENESEFISWLNSLSEGPDLLEIKEEIDKRLSWEYAFTYASKVPAKVSVTELKRRFSTETLSDNLSDTYSDSKDVSLVNQALGFTTKLIKKPKFLESEKGLNAAEKGTILHFVMQHLKLDSLREYAKTKEANDSNCLLNQCHCIKVDISKQIDSMVMKNLLTRKQADCVDSNKIKEFFESDLGIRMLSSNSINREIPFNMELPIKELYNEIQSENYKEETILLQGVIDCFFEEEDEIVLVDYKTDYVKEGEENIIIERYKLQLELYSRALFKLTGKKVKEKYVYLFWNGKVIEFR